MSLSLGLLLSCAQTVTDKDIVLNIDITVQFRSNIDPEKYNYGIAFGSELPKTPIPPPYEFFPTPGFNYDEDNEILIANNGINYYYTHYFSSWSDYVYLENTLSRFQLIKSNASQFSADTNSNSLYSPEISFQKTDAFTANTLRIEFPLDQLSINPEILYIRFFVTEKTVKQTTVYQTGNLKDISQSENNAIQLSAQQEKYASEASQSQINGAADIIYWRVKVY